MQKTLCFSQIRPFIRYAQKIIISPSLIYQRMMAYDNRFFYVLDGVGNIRVGDAVYPMTKGSLLLWRSGIVYDLLCDEGQSMELIGFNFDFTQDNNAQAVAIPPAKEAHFRPQDVLDSRMFEDAILFNEPLYLKNVQETEATLIGMYHEYCERRLWYADRLSALFLQVLTDIARASIETERNSHTKSGVAAVLQYIRHHYQEDLSNDRIGRELNYHANYINRLMVRNTGLSLHQYVLRYRIERAIHYLQTTDLTAAQIAGMVGFKDYNFFLKYFKKTTGYTTRYFRKG